jgi:hypothetical protein
MGTFLNPTFTEIDGRTGATWQDDGNRRPIFVPPGFRATNLEKLAKEHFVTGTVAVLCVQVDDVWYLSPELDWVYKDPPPSGSQVRCP